MERDKVTLVRVGDVLTVEVVDPVPGTKFRIGGVLYQVTRGGCVDCPRDYPMMREAPRCINGDRYDHGFYLRKVTT